MENSINNTNTSNAVGKLQTSRQRVPIIPTRETVVFPNVTTTLCIGRPCSIAAVQFAFKSFLDGQLVLVAQKNAKNEIRTSSIETVGVRVSIIDYMIVDGGLLKVRFYGIQRVAINNLSWEGNILYGDTEQLDEIRLTGTTHNNNHLRVLAGLFIDYVDTTNCIDESLDANAIKQFILQETNASDIIDIISHYMDLPNSAKYLLLAENSQYKRMEVIQALLCETLGRNLNSVYSSYPKVIPLHPIVSRGEDQTIAFPELSTTFKVMIEKHLCERFHKQLLLLDAIQTPYWQAELLEGKLYLNDNLEFELQLLGSWSEQNGTWLWAWANNLSQLPEAILEDAKNLALFGEDKKLPELLTGKFRASEMFGHHIGIVASALCNANAYYRCPYNNGAAYVLIRNSEFFRSIEIPTVNLGTHAVKTINKALLTFSSCNHRIVTHSYLQFLNCKISTSDSAYVGLLPNGEQLWITFDKKQKMRACENIPSRAIQ